MPKHFPKEFKDDVVRVARLGKLTLVEFELAFAATDAA